MTLLQINLNILKCFEEEIRLIRRLFQGPQCLLYWQWSHSWHYMEHAKHWLTTGPRPNESKVKELLTDGNIPMERIMLNYLSVILINTTIKKRKATFLLFSSQDKWLIKENNGCCLLMSIKWKSIQHSVGNTSDLKTLSGDAKINF